jgi:large subunit ribosomal protein L17
MRHLKAGRKLGRNAEHRVALMRNLTRALIEHERIITTVAKAKEARRFVEKVITLARKAAKLNDKENREEDPKIKRKLRAQQVHYRRLAIARLGPVAKTTLYDKKDEPTEDSVLTKLFKDIGKRFKDRPGGYTRVIKRHERRLGDAGPTAFLELLKAGEVKVRAKAPAKAPAAPKVDEDEEEESETQ